MNNNVESSHLKNYVLNGAGIGFKITATFAFLMAIMSALLIGFAVTSKIADSNVNALIETMPVIRVVNGKIIEPISQNVIPLSDGFLGKETNLVYNTTVDSVTNIPDTALIYITAKDVYIRDDKSEVIRYPIPAELTADITHDVMKQSLSYLVWTSSIIFGGMVFVFGIFAFVMLVLCVRLLGSLVNKDLTFGAWGRLMAYPWCIMWVGYTFFVLMDINISVYMIFISILLVTLFGGYFLKNQTETMDSNI